VIHAQVRPAGPNDHQRLSNLIFFETRSHRHLDWRSPLEWLGDEYFWMLEEGQQVSAALACPEEARGIAWIRLFVHSALWSGANAWNAMWGIAREQIAKVGGAQVAAIVQHAWFQKILEAEGFESCQRIVMLERADQPHVPHEAPGIHIRKLKDRDLSQVARLDLEAFGPLWHNTQDTLQRALMQSLTATVAENEQGVIGYQISTHSGQRAHLARLAVNRSMQGHGVARALLGDLFTFLSRNGYIKLSVNTQSDNERSLKLYQRMGFVRTGEAYPVYTFDIPSSN